MIIRNFLSYPVLFAALLFTGCAAQSHHTASPTSATTSNTSSSKVKVAEAKVSEVEVSEVKDIEDLVAFHFRRYVEKGFLITQLQQERDYRALGEIRILGEIDLTFWPETEKQKTREKALQKAQKGSTLRAEGRWVIRRLLTYDLVEAAYEEAKGMGADALVGFSLTPKTREIKGGPTVTGFEASGLTLKRSKRDAPDS